MLIALYLKHKADAFELPMILPLNENVSNLSCASRVALVCTLEVHNNFYAFRRMTYSHLLISIILDKIILDTSVR